MNGLRGALRGLTARERGARALGAICRFAFAPASAAPLAALRIGVALVLLLQAAMVAPAFFELYGRASVLEGPPDNLYSWIGLPRLGWIIDHLAPFGIRGAWILAGTGVLYAASLVALLVGWRARAAAALAWSTHFLLLMEAYNTNYGVDYFAHIFLFYLVWMPSGAALSLDRARRRERAGPTAAARLACRVVQLHLCVAYLSSGLAKAAGEQWWNGEAIWRALMLPAYRQVDMSWLADHAWLPRVAGWAVLLVEIGYPVFIWPRRTRAVWIAAIVALHVGIAVFLGLTLFGLLMPVLTLAAFGVSAEPPPLSATSSAALPACAAPRWPAASSPHTGSGG